MLECSGGHGILLTAAGLILVRYNRRGPLKNGDRRICLGEGRFEVMDEVAMLGDESDGQGFPRCEKRDQGGQESEEMKPDKRGPPARLCCL